LIDHAKVREVANVYFTVVKPNVQPDDQVEIIELALSVAATGKHNAARSSINTYCERLIDWSYRAYFAQQKRDRELHRSLTALAVEESAILRTAVDIFEEDPAVFSQGMEDFSSIMTPRYRVEFDEYSPEKYISDPYYVPGFELIPAKPFQLAQVIDKGGKLRATDLREISLSATEALNSVRWRYGTAVREMVSEYIREYGWISLRLEHRRIIACLNKGMRPSKIQQEMRLKESTYYSYRNVVERRGWREIWHKRKGHLVLEYQPPLDRARRFHDDAPMANTAGLSLRQRLELTGLTPGFEEVMAEKGAEVLDEGFLAIVSGQMEHNANPGVLSAYDQRLRTFIDRLIMRPLLTEGLTFDQVMETVANLPSERQKALIFEAIKRKKSIGDMLGLKDAFPEAFLVDSDCWDGMTLKTLASFA
jgi:hypothetical protein